MQAKGKDWKTGVGMGDVVAGQQLGFNGLHAALHWLAGELGKLAGGALAAGNAGGRSSTEPAGLRLGTQTKGGLDPHGQGIGDEGMVVLWWQPLRITDPLGQIGDKGGIAGITLGGGPLQRFTNNAFGFDLISQQRSGHARNLLLLFGESPLAGQRG